MLLGTKNMGERGRERKGEEEESMLSVRASFLLHPIIFAPSPPTLLCSTQREIILFTCSHEYDPATFRDRVLPEFRRRMQVRNKMISEEALCGALRCFVCKVHECVLIHFYLSLFFLYFMCSPFPRMHRLCLCYCHAQQCMRLLNLKRSEKFDKEGIERAWMLE